MRHPVTIICLMICATFILVAALGPLILPKDPLTQSFLARLKPPSAEYWFGTDRYGRDVFSRVLSGTRWSLLLGLSAPLISGVIGTLIGALAGFYGGWFDRIAGRLSDLLMAFPSLLLGILLAAALAACRSGVVVIRSAWVALDVVVDLWCGIGGCIRA